MLLVLYPHIGGESAEAAIIDVLFKDNDFAVCDQAEEVLWELLVEKNL